MPRTVNGGTYPVIVGGPEVAVGVERLRGIGVPERLLHGLHRAASADERRGEVVAQIVERHAWATHGFRDQPDLLDDPLPADAPSVGVDEQEPVSSLAELGEVGGE